MSPQLTGPIRSTETVFQNFPVSCGKTPDGTNFFITMVVSETERHTYIFDQKAAEIIGKALLAPSLIQANGNGGQG